MFDLCGRKAIVTGGREGLGRAIAEAYARMGAEVVIIDRAEDTESFAKTLTNKSVSCRGVTADLLDRTALDHAFDESFEKLGGVVDILVNSAGIRFSAPAEQHPIGEWDRLIAINLTAVFLMCQHAGRAMLTRGKGSIINMASIRSFSGSYDAVAYGTSKGGIAQLTKSLSNEWAGRGVRVNAIAPGFMLTNLAASIVHDSVASNAAVDRIPAGRWGTPQDLVGLAVLLASDSASYITGAIIPCDGGFLAR